jgi:hypothetical protein
LSALSDLFREVHQGIGLQLVEGLLDLDSLDVGDRHPNIATDRYDLNLLTRIHIFVDLMHDPANTCLDDGALLVLRCLEFIDLFENAKRAETVSIRKEHVPTSNHQDLGAATPHLDDDGLHRGQDRVGLKHGLDSHVGDPVDLSFVQRLDFQTGGDVDAIDERKSIRRLAYGAGCHHTDLVRTGDPILQHESPIAFQYAGAVLNAASADLLGRERVLAQCHCLRHLFQGAYIPRAVDFGNRHSHAGRTNVDHRDRVRARHRVGWRVSTFGN